MPNTEFNKQLEILAHKDLGLSETRTPTSSVPPIFFLYDAANMVVSSGSSDTFVGINPRGVRSGLAKDVSYLTTLVIDIDPVRPKGEGSTDEQVKASLKLGEKIIKDYRHRYINGTIHLVSSGCGSHVYIPIDPIKVTNYRNLTASLKLWSDKVKKVYQTKELKIDSIFDLSRIIRVWGSTNSKSGRTCKLIKSWEGVRVAIKFSQDDVERKPVTVASGLEIRFQRALSSNGYLSSHMNESVSFASRSEADYSFIGALLKSGFNVPEIKVLAKKNPLGRQNELRAVDVDRVTEKFINNGLKVKSTSVYVDKYFKSLRNRKFGIPIGLKKIDAATGGLRSEVTIISARPGNGKTSLMCQMAYNISLLGKTVALFPTELGTGPVFDKIMAQISGVDLTKFRDGSFTKEDFDKLHGHKEDFAKLPLVVIEDFSLTLAKIKKKVDEIRPDVVMIDYIQAMRYSSMGGASEIAEVMQGLTDIAGSRDIPVVVASQLSRPTEVSQLSMSHLKGSGALEEKARVVQALTIVDWHSTPRPVDLHILKNSYGEVGKFPLTFHKNICKFEEGRK